MCSANRVLSDESEEEEEEEDPGVDEVDDKPIKPAKRRGSVSAESLDPHKVRMGLPPYFHPHFDLKKDRNKPRLQIFRQS